MNLVKYQAPNNLPAPIRANLEAIPVPAERETMERALGTKVKDLPAVDAASRLLAIIATAYTLSGQQIDAQTGSTYARELHRELCKRYPGITLEEISEAFRRGIFDEYGEYYGLNVKTFMHFAKCYYKHPDRLQALKQWEHRRTLQLEGPKPTPEEEMNSTQGFCNLLYSEFLKDRLPPPSIPSFVFDFLEGAGKIKLTNAEKWEIYQRAEVGFLTRLQLGNFKPDDQRFKLALFSFNNGTAENSVKQYAKQIAIHEYFTRCKEEGSDKIFTDAD